MTQTQSELARTIVSIIADEAGMDESNVGMSSKLGSDVPLDSLGMVEVTMRTEEVFGIELPDEALDSITTVEDFIALVETRLGA